MLLVNDAAVVTNRKLLQLYHLKIKFSITNSNGPF
jgi:hypothetical protein